MNLNQFCLILVGFLDFPLEGERDLLSDESETPPCLFLEPPSRVTECFFFKKHKVV